MPPTMPYEFGDVVLVRFPFTNQTAFKQRPAVVISNRAYSIARPDAVIMAITSQLHSPSSLGEVWISQWQAANLLKPSAIKPVFATLEQSLILKRLGILQPSDQSALRQAIAAVLG
jgi:mRNA interferase MazF